MKYLLCGLLINCLLMFSAEAQSGWQTSRYYDEKGQEDIICGNCYSVFAGYNIYRQPIYNYIQNCRQRKWYSWYGNHGGYYWNCNYSPCQWQFYVEVRTWWYFTWYDFVRPC